MLEVAVAGFHHSDDGRYARRTDLSNSFFGRTAQQQTDQVKQEKVACVRDKNDVVADARSLHTQLQHEIDLRQNLVRQLPEASRHQLEAQHPELVQIKPAQISPKLLQEFQKPIAMNH